MEIRNIIKDNKTGEILKDIVMEIPDDELDNVVGGISTPINRDKQQINESSKFSPVKRKFTPTTKR